MRIIKANRSGTADVFTSLLNRQRGMLRLGLWQCPLSLGRNGTRFDKREGDGTTPVCDLRPVRLFLRPDQRSGRSPRFLPWRFLHKEDGWCDASLHASYNRLIKKPFSASHEDMWRQDRLYNAVIETDWNKKPRKQQKGSAIFVHLQRNDKDATAGCLALSSRNMRILLQKLDQIQCFRIQAPGRKPVKKI